MLILASCGMKDSEREEGSKIYSMASSIAALRAPIADGIDSMVHYLDASGTLNVFFYKGNMIYKFRCMNGTCEAQYASDLKKTWAGVQNRQNWSVQPPEDRLDSMTQFMDSNFKLRAYMLRGESMWNFNCEKGRCDANYRSLLKDQFSEGNIKNQAVWKNAKFPIPTKDIDVLSQYYDGNTLKSFIYKQDRRWEYNCAADGCKAIATKSLAEINATIIGREKYSKPLPTSVDAVSQFMYQGKLKVYLVKGDRQWLYQCTGTRCEASFDASLQSVWEGVTKRENWGEGGVTSQGSEDTPPPTMNPGLPTLIVQYHVWFDTPYGVPASVKMETSKPFALWDLNNHGNTGLPSPDTFKADGWRRNGMATKEGYPLIGFYDPDDPKVLRWHIKLAKAAGIQAFAVSVYNWGNGNAEKRMAEITKKMLDISQEENFKITLEVWCGGPDNPGFFKRHASLIKHPAFLRVDGLPLVWIAPGVAPSDYFGTTPAAVTKNLGEIENALGTKIYWAVNNGVPGLEVSEIQRKVIKMTSPNIGGTTTDGQFLSVASHGVNHARTKGIKVGTHIYPGFEELAYNRPNPRYTSRRGGANLQNALKVSNDLKADIIFLESWNDFGESTGIEPGYKEDLFQGPYQRDPYKDLRIIAASRGISYTPPKMIDASAMDPAVRQKLASKVVFRGKVGFPAGSKSNGVFFHVTSQYYDKWLTLVSKNVKPSDGDVKIETSLDEFYGKNRPLILGVGAGGDSYSDGAYWLEARIEINGVTVIDLINDAPKAHWHSSQSNSFKFGTASDKGSAAYGYDVKTVSGATYAKTIYVHPDYSANGFSHGGYNLNILKP